MEVKAIAKYQRVSAQKARLVAALVRGKAVEDALNVLRFTPKKSAGIMYKVVHSAMSNAMANANMDVDSLFIKEVLDFWWQLSGIFGGAMLGLFILSLMERIKKKDALAGLAAGLIITIWGIFFNQMHDDWAWLSFPLHKFLVGALATFSMVIVSISSSMLRK